MMKIWHISDTHGRHAELKVPSNTDCVIHSGDCSSHRDPARNANEVLDFIAWYGSLEIPYKIYVPGNHDVSIEHGLIRGKDFGAITLLINNYTTIYDQVIWGSPYTPKFSDWAFTRPRKEMEAVWDLIYDKTTILVTHGPPKGILDLVDQKSVGCQELIKKVCLDVQPRYHLFGHIHQTTLYNLGTRTIPTISTYFSNGSIVLDDMKQYSNGNLIEC